MTKRSAAERAAEIRAGERLARSGQYVSVAKYAIVALCVGYGLTQISEIVASLAGKETIADIGFGGKLLLRAGINNALAVLLGGGSTAVTLRYRTLLNRTRKEMGQRIQVLEAQLDNRRSSSKLTPSGQTNPEDR